MIKRDDISEKNDTGSERPVRKPAPPRNLPGSMRGRKDMTSPILVSEDDEDDDILKALDKMFKE